MLTAVTLTPVTTEPVTERSTMLPIANFFARQVRIEPDDVSRRAGSRKRAADRY